jgi:hypothetical protein
MTKSVAFAILSLAALAGCSGTDRGAPVDMALDQPCTAISSTGDMYRYCLEVGPQQALLEVDGPGAGSGAPQTAVALTSHARR